MQVTDTLSCQGGGAIAGQLTGVRPLFPGYLGMQMLCCPCRLPLCLSVALTLCWPPEPGTGLLDYCVLCWDPLDPHRPMIPSLS